MFSFNIFVEAFQAIFNSSKFTLTLIVWGGVIVATCAVTMSDLNSSRRKLWSFVISAIGAVGIMLHLESFEGLSDAEVSTRVVMTNFVVMTLGGLGSGLLGLAIIAGPDKEDPAKFRNALYSVFEQIYFFIVLSSLIVSVLCHTPIFSGSRFFTDAQCDGILVVLVSAIFGCLLSACRSKKARLDDWISVFLFLFLLIVLAIYANALTDVWIQLKEWVIVISIVLGLFVRALAKYYRNKALQVSTDLQAL
ncbi:hypothetical protein [Pseudomonas sp. 1152_12]|uniref:hypothetical protein n=1 Tax=Pseudomonas sp. 1152_12 TaxID=2604455 RepID=UPI004062A4C2